MYNIIQNNQFSFKNRFRECHMCKDGKSYSHTEDCKDCNNSGRVKKSSRNQKCSSCEGKGYTYLKSPQMVGICPYCSGTRKVALNSYDQISKEEKEWIFENLFNFHKEYEGNHSSFNENYLGIGVVCGVTDYGRHKSMNAEEFKREVKNNFLSGYLQYVSIMKDGELPREILIRKSRSGWFAYPVYLNFDLKTI